MPIDESHEVSRTLKENIIYPAHEERTESAIFRENKKLLVDELDIPCLICGSKEKREVHHIFEWSLFPALDTEKMKSILKIIDFYGYSKQDDTPIESPDDKRNLIVLCETHHREENNGIHAISFPIWISQMAVKDGIDITPETKIIKTKDKKLTNNIKKTKKVSPVSPKIPQN